MDIVSLLASIEFPLLSQNFGIDLGWLGQIIRALIEGIGITGVGIIVFTLILKAITLPFDIYQRVKMRKQSLVMRDMKDDLEKYQKQYANDKEKYNEKLMELYKKNGYSPLSACLPMLVSLAILMVAFWGLNSYSQYANLSIYTNMMNAYNETILTHCEIAETDEDGYPVESGTIVVEEEVRGNEGTYVIVSSTKEDKFIYYEYNKTVENGTVSYRIDIDKLYAHKTQEINALMEASKNEAGAYTDASGETVNEETARSLACRTYVRDLGAQAAADNYHENSPGFLWIQNIWYPDVSYNHPIQSYDDFLGQRNIGNEKVIIEGDERTVTVKDVLTRDVYENITSKLVEEKDAPNGYFVLIILSIGLMFLSQFLSMRSQKESNKYQSVDGSGAMTQKIMLFVMPLVYAIFAFMYSAAFSIYMTMSSVIGILVTVISNFFIGRSFRKKEEEEFRKKYTRSVPSRQAYQKRDEKDKRK